MPHRNAFDLFARGDIEDGHIRASQTGNKRTLAIGSEL
jgi:hypothetical protein